MKQKDIALIIAVAGFSAVFSLLLSRLLIAPPKNRQTQVEIVQPITADFQKPDTRYFNSQSFDPTKLIKIGESSNPVPFSTKESQ